MSLLRLERGKPPRKTGGEDRCVKLIERAALKLIWEQEGIRRRRLGLMVSQHVAKRKKL